MGFGQQRADPGPLSVTAHRATPPVVRPPAESYHSVRGWRRPILLVGGPMLLGLLHVALIAPRYHVGSFDDDASYILAAKALLSGQGLTGHLVSGEAVVGLYLPGFGALLAPLVWLWPHGLVDLRLLSVAGYAAVFPLTWLLLRRRRLSEGVIAVALVVLALGPVFATFGSMVMAEMPFLVVLLVLLLLADDWLASSRLLGPAGIGVMVAAAALLWLKEAGLGLVVGLVLWLPLSRSPRRWAKAAVLAGFSAVAVLPGLIARYDLGIPLAGGRYSEELGSYYQGSLAERVLHVLPESTWHLLATAIPATLVPYLAPLPLNGHWPDLWKALSWQVTLLCAVGAVTWFRRYRDPAVAMTVVYLGESVLWPFVNERRAILVLPLLVGWYGLGAAVTWRALRGWVGRAELRWTGAPTALAAVAAVAAVAVTFAPLVAQAPRDYLFGWGQSSSDPRGSGYMEMLAALSPRSAVVETDYRSTVALYSGHPTAWTAFYDTTVDCYEPTVLADLAADHAAFVLLGDLNKPDQIDSPCIAGLIGSASWAVPLLHTARDDATVYELIGPDTANPGLVDDLTSASPPLETTAGDDTVWTWQWSAPVAATQLSLGAAADLSGPTTEVRLQYRDAAGGWITAASAPSGIGGCTGCAPFLLDSSGPVEVTSVRVVVTGPTGPGAVGDLAVLGPAGPSTR